MAKNKLLDYDELRARLEDHRVFLVTNRRAVDVECELRARVGLRVTWVDSTHPRQLDAARSTVRQGACELVLVATAFVGHDVDMILKSACKQAEIPFLAVNKGGLQACILALMSFVSRKPR